MLVGSLDDYHLGGIDEMSARTVSCWSNLTRWLAHGIGKEEKLQGGWDICDVFQAIKARGGAGNPTVGGTAECSRKMGNYNPMGEGIMLQRSEKEYARIRVRTDKFGAEIYTLPPLEDKEIVATASVASSPLPMLSSARAPKFQEPTFVATYAPYSHFGASISIGEFSTSGPALAVGAPYESEDSARPGEGNVYILPLSDLLGSPSVSTALQPEYLSKAVAGQLQRAATDNGLTDQRFGASSTALKTLGTTLLAIAAPGPYTYDNSIPPSPPFAGTSPAGRIDLFRPGEPSRFLSLSVKGAELGSIGQRWWGESMISADLDGTGDFLVVSGSSSDGQRLCDGHQRPQMGEGEVGVFQFIAAPSSTASPPPHSVSPLELTLGEQRIASGATTINTWSITLPASEKPTTCDSTYEYFGRTLAFLAHSRTLFIGAPGANAVYAYTFSNNAFSHAFTIRGPPSNSRAAFGGSGIASGVTPAGHVWLAVGAADASVGSDTQAGVLHIYTLTSTGARAIAEVVAEAGKAGRRYAKFGRTVVADGSGGGVWVGSEFWDGERGAAWWVDIEAIVEAAVKRGGGAQVVFTPGGSEGVDGERVDKVDKVERMEVQVQVQGGEPNVSFVFLLLLFIFTLRLTIYMVGTVCGGTCGDDRRGTVGWNSVFRGFGGGAGVAVLWRGGIIYKKLGDIFWIFFGYSRGGSGEVYCSELYYHRPAGIGYHFCHSLSLS